MTKGAWSGWPLFSLDLSKIHESKGPHCPTVRDFQPSATRVSRFAVHIFIVLLTIWCGSKNLDLAILMISYLTNSAPEGQTGLPPVEDRSSSSARLKRDHSHHTAPRQEFPRQHAASRPA